MSQNENPIKFRISDFIPVYGGIKYIDRNKNLSDLDAYKSRITLLSIYDFVATSSSAVALGVGMHLVKKSLESLF